jgi:hypothetical protein
LNASSTPEFQSFEPDIFYPAMKKGIPGGFTSPLIETTFNVHALHSK